MRHGKTIQASDLRLRTGSTADLYDFVEGGGVVVITRKGRPIARLMPLAAVPESTRGDLAAEEDREP